jgi:PAS domain S-box-containing protein
MSKLLRVLIVEDSDGDAQLMIRALKKGGCDPVYQRVETAESMRSALAKEPWDLILCDYQMPQFNGLAAVEVLKGTGIDIPLIIVSGAIGEETAVECMRLGARDFFMKGKLSRLSSAVDRELTEAESRRLRKQAEEALKKSQNLLVETEKIGKVGGWEFNIDTGKQSWTEEIYNIHEVDLAYDPTVEQGIHFYAPTSRPIIERAVQRTLEHGESFNVELEIITAKGNLRSVHTIGKADLEHRRVYGFFQDITERKQAENLGLLARKVLDILNKPEGSLDTIRSILHLIKKCLNFQAVGIRLKEGDDFPYYETNGFPEDFVRAEKYLCAYDEEGKIVRDSKDNLVLECMCGNIISGRTDAALPFFTKEGSFWTNSTTDLLASTTEKDRQARTRNRCNGEGYESLALIPLRAGNEVIGMLQLNDRRRNMFTPRMINFFEDLGSSIGIALTRKRAENDLKQALERLDSLTSYVDSMYLVDRDCTYRFMNGRHLERFGLSLAEVVGKKYSEFHSEEDATRFAEDVNDVCETGKPITKEHRSERDGKFFLRTFTPIIGQGSNGKVSQIAIISKEITNIKLAEKSLRETLESLRKAVNTTIRVMVAAVETRDPYTAGHQMRSADLARAIATEMGLPQDKIEGIRMACSIHDIGKLSIPAEILSKPTTLSSIELLLIKEHAQRGYEILKDVESPWPLAEIVHQHHERMDGSGYPRNLRGEEILIEARILAVADVVEAMASHRPYRAGLGIDAALNEIEKNKGIFFDNTVADACLRLFYEKGFKLEET